MRRKLQRPTVMTRELRPEGHVYRIEAAVGQGLSATVYRAIREDSRGMARQTVALKVLKSENAVPWLRREFETLEGVRSPNCVRVLGWENLKDGCALVLEWIDGVSLLELGRENTLSTQAIESVLTQIQSGLRSLHQKGLFHGDLSPANVLIDREGVAKLIDFALPEGTSNEILGTPAYLAPEHWRGEPRTIQGDIFALGLIAHDLKTSFAKYPCSNSESKARAFALADDRSGWLARRPSDRRFRDIEVSTGSQRELRDAVRAHLARSLKIQTAIANERGGGVVRNHRFRFQTIAASIAAAGIMLTGAGRADAPALGRDQRGVLQVRSQKWLEVALNGRAIGFAPVTVENVHPGTHRISWKSATGAGEARVLIRPGERILIRADELKSSPAVSRPGLRAHSIKD